jgi:hypothetical protein
VPKFLAMKEAQAALGEGIRKDALPAVAGLKTAINGLPPSGSAWAYAFDISVNGQVPRLPSAVHGAAPGTGAHQAQQWLASQWAGGPLSGAGITIVGDSPGGGMTPYTEAIINGKYVLDAKTTRKLAEAGLLGNAMSRAFGGEIESPYTLRGSPSRVATGTSIRRPRSTSIGTRAGVTSSTVAGNLSASDASAVDTANIAAAVAEQAVSTAGIAVAAQDSVANNMQIQTAQQVQATQASTDNIVAALERIEQRLAKLPTNNSMYNIMHNSPLTSI